MNHRVFCGLLGGGSTVARGVYAIELVGQTHCSLGYRGNTPRFSPGDEV